MNDGSQLDTLFVDLRLRTNDFVSSLSSTLSQAERVAMTAGATAGRALNTGFSLSMSSLAAIQSQMIATAGQQAAVTATAAGRAAGMAWNQGFANTPRIGNIFSNSVNSAIVRQASVAGRLAASALGAQLNAGMNTAASVAVGQIASRINTTMRSTSFTGAFTPLASAAASSGRTAGSMFAAAFSAGTNRAMAQNGPTFTWPTANIVQAGTRFAQTMAASITSAWSSVSPGIASHMGSSMAQVGTVIATSLGRSMQGLEPLAAQTGRNIGAALTAGIQTAAVGIAALAVSANQMKNLAVEADNARISMEVWGRTTAKAGIDAQTANASIDNMSASLKVSKIALMENAAGLLRAGYSMEQVESIYTVAAASAVRAGKTTAYGIEQVNQAILTGNSRFLNTIGIRLNLVDAEKMYAAQLGKTKSELTDAERLQARVNLLWKDSGSEVEFLAGSLSGLSGSLSDQQIAMESLRQSVGTAFIPVTTMAIKAVNSFVVGLTEWAKTSDDARSASAFFSSAFINISNGAKNAYDAIKSFLNSDGFRTFANEASTAISAVYTSVKDFVSIIKENWPKISTQVGDFAKSISSLWQEVGPILDALRRSFMTISPIIIGVGGAIASVATSIVKVIDGLVKTVVGLLTGDWKKAWDGASQAVQAASDMLKDPLKSIEDGIDNMINNITELWASGGKSWGTAAAEGVTSAVDKTIADNQKKIAEYQKIIAQRDTMSLNAIDNLTDPLGLTKNTPATQPKQNAPQMVPDLGFSSFVKQLNSGIKITVMQELGANPDKYRLTGGKGHPGIDYQIGSGPFGGEMGAGIYAPASFEGARVLRADNKKSGYGNSVELELTTGYRVLLGHFKELGVKAGQTLAAGMQIGTQGNTGWGFSSRGSGEGKGPVHLHIEARDSKNNIVFDQGMLESVLLGARPNGDGFIDKVNGRNQIKAVEGPKDPSFAQMVTNLVRINKELEAATDNLKANPNSPAATARFKAASDARAKEADRGDSYKDKNLYDAAKKASEEIVISEKESNKLNDIKVKQFLPEAVRLLQRQKALEGETGVVATANLKEYAAIKNRIVAIGKDDNGQEALNLAQKRIDAEKQGIALTDAMTAEALKLARAYKLAKDNAVIDPKGFAAATEAIDKFTSKGRGQAFAISWATDAISKEPGPAFESQIANAEKLTQKLFQAQQMAFGPTRAAAIAEASDALKQFGDSSKNAALAVQFASEKYSRLQALTDSQKQRTQKASLPGKLDSQLASDLKAELAKGAAADKSFVDAIQAEIDKRTESRNKKRQEWLKRMIGEQGANAEASKALGANAGVLKEVDAIKAKYGSNPLLSLVDNAELDALQVKLAKLAKEQSGTFAGELLSSLGTNLSDFVNTIRKVETSKMSGGQPEQDRADRLSAIQQNRSTIDQVQSMLEFLASNPAAALVDPENIDQLNVTLEKLSKQPGGDYFAGLKDQLNAATEAAQKANDVLIANAEIQDANNFDTFNSTAIDDFKARVEQVKADLEADPLLILDPDFAATLKDLETELATAIEFPDLYDQSKVGKLNSELSGVTAKATELAASLSADLQATDANDGTISQLKEIGKQIDDLKAKIEADPISVGVDSEAVDAIAIALDALGESTGVKALRDEFDALIESQQKFLDDNKQGEAVRSAAKERIASEGDGGAFDRAKADFGTLLQELQQMPQISLNFDTQSAYADLLQFFRDTGRTAFADSLEAGWNDATRVVASQALTQSSAENANRFDETRNRLDADFEQLKSDTASYLTKLEQFPGLTLLDPEEFNFLKLQLSRLSSDPVFGGFAKRLTDDLEAGWKGAQEAVSAQEAADLEQNIGAQKAAARDSAMEINDAAKALVDAFGANGDVGAFLSGKQAIKIAIEGQGLTSQDSVIDSIIEDTVARLDQVSNKIGSINQDEISSIRDQLALNQTLFDLKARSVADYYTTRRDLGLKSNELEYQDAKDALDKQYSDGVMSATDYYNQLDALSGSRANKDTQVGLEFKLPAIDEATAKFQQFVKAVNNAEDTNPVYDSLVALNNEIKKFQDDGNGALLTQEQQDALSGFGDRLLVVSDRVLLFGSTLEGIDSAADGSIGNIIDLLDELQTAVEQVTLGQISPADFVDTLKELGPLLNGFDLAGLDLPADVQARLKAGVETLGSYSDLFASSAPQARVFGDIINKLAADVDAFTEANRKGELTGKQYNEQLLQLKNRSALLSKNPMNTGFFASKTSKIEDVLGGSRFGQEALDNQRQLEGLNAGLNGLVEAYGQGRVGAKRFIEVLNILQSAFQQLSESAGLDPIIADVAKQNAKAIDGIIKDTESGIKQQQENRSKFVNNIADLFKSSGEAFEKGGSVLQKIIGGVFKSIAAFVRNDFQDIGGAIADGIGIIGQVFATGDSMVDGPLNDFLSGISNGIKSFASGDWVGGIVNVVGGVVSGIIGAINNGTESVRRANEELKQYADKHRTSFVDYSQFGKTTQKYTGGFQDFFGKTTFAEFDPIAESIADAISSGMDSGFRAGIKAFMNGDDNWQDIIKDAMRDALINGFIEAFIQQTVLQGILAAPMAAVTKAFQSGDQSEIDKAMAALGAALPGAMEAINKFVPGVASAIDKVLPQKPKAGPGSYDYEASKLNKLQEQYNKESDAKAREDLQKQIDQQSAVVDGLKSKSSSSGGGSTPATPGSLDAENATLRDLQDQYGKESDAQKRLVLAGKIEKQQSKIKNMDPLNAPQYNAGDILKRNPDGSLNLSAGGTYITGGQVTKDGKIEGLPTLAVPDVATGDVSVPFGTSVKNFGMHVDKFGEYMAYAKDIKEAALSMSSSSISAQSTDWMKASKR